MLQPRRSLEMRAIFGVLGLVLVLGIVGWLAKTQLASTRQAVPPMVVPGANSTSTPASAPAATVRDQSQQLQQQIKQSVEAAMQQSRPMPDDK
jgi:hypothetical protein